MEWITRLNEAIDYMEENLTEEMNYERLAQIACCSTYHFQRMFTYMAGMPLSEYIRKRRMSLAAVDLQGGDEKIVDVALKYGYESPTAFNRAFQSVHGVAPSEAKKAGSMLRAYPPIRFLITVRGAEEMKYRIEEKQPFRIVGVCQSMNKDIESNFEIVPQMWQKAAMEGTIPQLAGMMSGEPMGLLGVSVCNDQEEWKYFIAVASHKPAGDGFEEYVVPAFTWAIFPGEGVCPGAIQELEQRIVAEWLPTSGYEYDNGPDIELYLNPDPQQAQFEVWIPVIKK